MRERNTGIHNFLALIKEATKERPVGIHVASITDMSPIKFVVNDLDVELGGSDVIINPDLLERIEYGRINIGDSAQEVAIEFNSRLFVGDEVLIISNTDTSEFYVVSKTSGGG